MAILGTTMGLATLLLLVPSIAAVAIGIAIVGAADGPFNIWMFSLRQRRTARAWFGRAFAVSMSLNFAGIPIGSALAGPILGISIPVAVVLAALLMVSGGVLMLLKIPSGRTARLAHASAARRPPSVPEVDDLCCRDQLVELRTVRPVDPTELFDGLIHGALALHGRARRRSSRRSVSRPTG